MKNICSKTIFVSVLFGFLVLAAPARAQETTDSTAPASAVPDLSSIVNVVGKADDFLKSDSVQKAKDKALPILNKLDAWRLGKLPKITALKEKAQAKPAQYFYATAEKAFSSKTIFFATLIILALAIIVRIKNVVLN